MSETVMATEAARDLIVQLKARHGSLIFMQSGGCCDGSSPVCLSEGELLLGPNDLLIGTIAGCPFYIDREQYERWRALRSIQEKNHLQAKTKASL